MDDLNIAVVCRDEAIRAALAERFDDAPGGWKVQLFDARPTSADVVVRGPDVTVEADVVFDPARPERLLPDIAAATRTSSKLFVVTGAGRGTGVTTTALHLARALATRAETCLVDLDVPWSGARDRLGLGSRVTLTWADVGSDSESLRLASIPVPGGFRTLLAPRPRAQEPTDDLLARSCASFGRVVVDLPAGEHDHGTIAAAARVLLLVPPTPAGLARAGQMFAARPAARWVVLLSRTGHGGEARVAEIAKALGRSVTLELPCTPALRDAEDGGRLLRGPWTRYNRRIARLALGLDAL